MVTMITTIWISVFTGIIFYEKHFYIVYFTTILIKMFFLEVIMQLNLIGMRCILMVKKIVHIPMAHNLI